MNKKTFNVLEFHKIVEMLVSKAVSESGKKKAASLKAAITAYEVEKLQQETEEALSVISAKGSPPIGAFYDCNEYVSFAGKGGVLTMRQLLYIRYNIMIAVGITAFFSSDTPKCPIISDFVDILSDLRPLANEIDRCIISEEEMADNASPLLHSLRRMRLQKEEAIRTTLSRMTSGAEYRQYMQDAIVTMRDGRYVLPVKQEYSAFVPGIVHDKSSTGATHFIEPEAVVKLNNELRRIQVDEQIEIDRILGELSAVTAAHGIELISDFEILTRLDFIFAKGRLAQEMGAVRPLISEDGRVYILSARHPLIDAGKAVPLTVEIGDKYNALIITGPNTGGKTVALKTVGLLTLMAQAGLHIPAAEGTIISRFSKIYADIGDEQSIEQSLSTFSSHMKNIVNIVNNADEHTLILLDELGAGTDPAEGAALAISILENLRGNGCTVFATTHYTELKKYALVTEGIENASMEFDVSTLSPTYKLRIGIPGKSNAFEISRKLGLPESIIRKAAELLDGGEVAFEEILSAIERDKQLIDAERDEAIMLNISMKKQREELEGRIRLFERDREKILDDARTKARSMIDEAAELSVEIKKELRKIPELDNYGERSREFEASRKRIHEAAARYRRSRGKSEKAASIDPKLIRIGDMVRILSLDSRGEVISLPDASGELSVDIGVARVRVNVSDLAASEAGQKQSRYSKNSKPLERGSHVRMKKNKVQNVSLETDVRGMYLADAQMQVEKYLDDAYLAGLEYVRIIHGRGEGILQSGIRDLLRENPLVKKFEKGGFHDGGDGVTVAFLKTD